MTHPDDQELDQLFKAVRAQSPSPSEALQARVLADAASVQQPHVVGQDARRPDRWAGLLRLIDGWPTLGGMTAATVAGFWVGFAPPAVVDDLTAGLIGDQISVEFYTPDLLFDAGAFEDG